MSEKYNLTSSLRSRRSRLSESRLILPPPIHFGYACTVQAPGLFFRGRPFQGCPEPHETFLTFHCTSLHSTTRPSSSGTPEEFCYERHQPSILFEAHSSQQSAGLSLMAIPSSCNQPCRKQKKCVTKLAGQSKSPYPNSTYFLRTPAASDRLLAL
jgi:hypothetical protein